MFIALERAIPSPIPISEEVVYYDTALPEISPILFRFANLILMDALDADDSR